MKKDICITKNLLGMPQYRDSRSQIRLIGMKSCIFTLLTGARIAQGANGSYIDFLK